MCLSIRSCCDGAQMKAQVAVMEAVDANSAEKMEEARELIMEAADPQSKFAGVFRRPLSHRLAKTEGGARCTVACGSRGNRCMPFFWPTAVVNFTSIYSVPTKKRASVPRLLP